MVQLNLEPADCKNLADMVEIYFFANIRDDDELDNIEYVRSILRGLDELKRVGYNA